MTGDALLRALERDAAAGDPGALRRLLAAEVRAGRVAGWQQDLLDLMARVRGDVLARLGRRHPRMSVMGEERYARLTAAAVDVAFGQLLGRDPRADGARLIARAWSVAWTPPPPDTEQPIVFGVTAAEGSIARAWLGVGETEDLAPLEQAVEVGRHGADLERRLRELDRYGPGPPWSLTASRWTVLAWLACERGETL